VLDRLSPLARNVALACLFALLGWFFWSVRSVLNPLILAYLLAFILHPLVLSLERRGWTRRAAVNTIFVTCLGALSLLGFVFFQQGRAMVRALTAEKGISEQVRARIEQGLHDYEKEIDWALKALHREAPADTAAAPGETPAGTAKLRNFEDLRVFVEQALQDWIEGGQAAATGKEAASWAIQLLKRVFGGVMAFLGLVVLLPIYTWFLLFELERIHSFVQRYLPRRDRGRLVKIGTQIGEVLSNFFRGRLLVCLCKGIFLALGLWIAGVQYWVLIGLGTGFLGLIPFVGSMIGFIVALLFGFLDYDVFSSLVRTGTVFLLAEALENYVLIPKILGDSLGLHPIVVIFSLLAGAASLGMFGLLIALPLTASLVILAREFVLPVLADLADQDRGNRGAA
jgi:predicted PurR-regulated permease PerM